MELKTAVKKLKQVASGIEFATRDYPRLKSMRELATRIIQSDDRYELLRAAGLLYGEACNELEDVIYHNVKSPWGAVAWRADVKKIVTYINVLEREQ